MSKFSEQIQFWDHDPNWIRSVEKSHHILAWY